MVRQGVRVTGRRQRVVVALGVLCGMVLLLVGMSTGVSSAAPGPITDVASYPPPMPAGCTVEGAAVVPGVQFNVNGQTSSDLRTLNIAPGDTVTMTWPAFAPGCETLGVGFSVKISQDVIFNIDDNQYLQSFTYCGPDGPACTTPGSISIQLPSADLVPCYQLDAHIGAPLAIVGPAGSYYGNTLTPGRPDMLISAQNGGTGSCEVPPCATDAAVPAAAILCTSQVTTTTTAPTPTTPTTEPVCATNPLLPASSPDCAQPSPPTTGGVCATNAAVSASSPECLPLTSCPPGEQMDAVTGQCLAASASNVGRQVAATIPVTGSHSQPLLVIAGILLAVGAPLTLLCRRPDGRRFVR